MRRSLILLLLLARCCSGGSGELVPSAWGAGVDPQGLAVWKFEQNRLSLVLDPKSGGVADYFPGRGFDAPHRALSVTGDFRAEIIASPITTLEPENGSNRNSWVASGLLVQVAPGTYARLLYGYTAGQSPEGMKMFWDLTRGGVLQTSITPRQMGVDPAQPIHFRVERRAGRLYGAAGPDAAHLNPIYPLNVSDWPATIQIGPIALDTGDDQLAAEFESFRVTPLPGPTTARPPEAPMLPPLTGPELGSWGRLRDPEGLGHAALEGETLNLGIAGTSIDLSGKSLLDNAPRVLREVEGDFTISVQVERTLKPEDPPRGGLGLFQSAGLMIDAGSGRMLRFDLNLEKNRNEYLHFEMIPADGRHTGGTEGISLAAGKPVSLRLTRTGSVITASARQDDDEWKPLATCEVAGWPARLQVGVEATNTTGNLLQTRFHSLNILKP